MGYKLKRILIYPDGVTEKQVYPAWNGDLSKATLVSSTQISGYIVYGIAFSDDGTKFYYQTNSNSTPGVFHQWDLSTPRDVSTKSNEKTFNFSVGSYTYGIYPQNIFFGNGGRFLCHGYDGNSDGEIKWYELSTPRDITSKTAKGQINLGGDYNASVWFSQNGKRFWYRSGNSSIGLGYKELTTPFTPELGTKIGTTAYGHWYFSPNGTYLYYKPSANQVKKMSLGNGYDFSNPTEVASLTVPGSGTLYSTGLYFDKTGNNMFVCCGELNAPIIYRYSLG